MQRDDAIHDGRRGDAVLETRPLASTVQNDVCAETLQQADNGRSSTSHCVQDTRAVVQVSRNETPWWSWQAELVFGPQDRIIVDGHSAAQAVQRLVAVLPAALAARQQDGIGQTMLTITVLHPSGAEVFVPVPHLDDDAPIADQVRRGERPGAPRVIDAGVSSWVWCDTYPSRGRHHTPVGIPGCHGAGHPGAVRETKEEPMNDKTSPQRSSPPLPWGPVGQPDPVQEYRVLAHELEESYPDAEPRQLDLMIAREMADYGGYSVEAITQAMRVASLTLARSQVDDPHAYVTHTVDEAMQQDPTQGGGLGWG